MKDKDTLVDLIHEIGLLAHHSQDLQSVLKSISQRILKNTNASLVAIALVSENPDEFVLSVGVVEGGGVLPLGKRMSIGTGIVGKVISSGQLMVIQDTSKVKEFIQYVPGMKSELTVPLIFGGKVIGVINLESKNINQFVQADISLLQAIASPVALSIENARLYQEERKRYTQMAMLNKINRVLTSTMNIDTLLDRVVETIRKQFNYHFVAIGLLDENNKIVLKSMSSSYPVDLPIGHAQEIGEGVAGTVLETGKSLLIPDIRNYDNMVPTHKDLLCEMCCPLRVGERTIGYLDAEAIIINSFEEDDLMVLELVADHISQAIDNAENLRRVNKLKENLTQMIIHDLRNPLTVIHSSIEMMENYGADLSHEKTKYYLDSAKSSCHDLIVLMESLLELQKIEEGKLDIKTERIHPSEIVKTVANTLKIKAEVMGKTLTYNIADQLPEVFVDRKLFLRVLQNLVINAIKFTQQGGRIQISLRPAAKNFLSKHSISFNEGILFSIKDTGSGIPPGELKNIFNKFTTLKSKVFQKPFRIGTGLGLTFCREVTYAHKGKIWAESELGKGSTFHILLPT
jgi:two-component system, NtrC family, sensor histidine kinase KinB